MQDHYLNTIFELRVIESAILSYKKKCRLQLIFNQGQKKVWVKQYAISNVQYNLPNRVSLSTSQLECNTTYVLLIRTVRLMGHLMSANWIKVQL